MSWDYEGLKKNDLKTIKNVLKSSGIYTFLPPDIQVWRPKDGKNRIRIVPGVSPAKENPEILPPKFSLVGVAWLLWLHRGIGDERKMFLCKQKMLGKPCVICSERKKVSDEVLKSAYKPSKVILAWVWDRSDAMREAEGLKLGLLPYTLFEEILAQTEDPETGELIDIFHPVTGRDVFFVREIGENGYPKYTGVRISTKESAVPEEFANEIKPISSLLQYPDDEELKTYLFGYIDVSDEVVNINDLEELKEEINNLDVEEDDELL